MPGLPGRMLAPDEVVALLDACARDSSHRGPRDALIVTLAAIAGLRRAEVCSLDRSSVIEWQWPPWAGPVTILVKGKGGRFRVVYLYGRHMDVALHWMMVRGHEPGPWLVSSTKGGGMTRARLTPNGLWRALRRRQVQAGIAPFSPHDLRRTMISTMLDRGVDMALVARLAGHVSIVTTALYDRRPQAAAKRAAGVVQVSYLEGMTHATGFGPAL